MNTNMTKIAYITAWIPTSEATEVIKSLIADGTFEKGQIKKSSYRFTNSKDKSQGYICRVVAEAGVHPEMEVGSLKRGRKTKHEVVDKTVDKFEDVNKKFKDSIDAMDKKELESYIACRKDYLASRWTRFSKDVRAKEARKMAYAEMVAKKAA